MKKLTYVFTCTFLLLITSCNQANTSMNGKPVGSISTEGCNDIISLGQPAKICRDASGKSIIVPIDPDPSAITQKIEKIESFDFTETDNGKTRSAQVAVLRYSDNFIITLHGKEILRSKSPLHIHKYEHENSRIRFVLVEKILDNQSCQKKFQVIPLYIGVFDPDGYTAEISKEFGSCDSDPQVSFENGTLSLLMVHKNKSSTKYNVNALAAVFEKEIPPPQPLCIETKSPWNDLLPCNSCELARKVLNGMADAYTESGRPDIAIELRNESKGHPHAIGEYNNEKGAAIVHEVLREKAKPKDIKLCGTHDLVDDPLVIQYRSFLRVNTMAFAKFLGYVEF